LVRTNNTLKKSDLLHFIIPIILFSLKNYFNNHNVFVGLKIGFFVLMFFNIGYFLAAYLFLKEKVWKRKSNIFVINQQNNIINNWTKLLFIFYLFILVRFFSNLLFNYDGFWYLNNNNFLWLGGLIWIIMYIKILYSPEFLYGYEVFQNKIKEYKKHDVIFDNIWILDNIVQLTNIQDSNLKEKMDGNVRNYIQEIEKKALNSSLFFDKKFDIPILAISLKIPNSHLNYLFKYHSAISFPEFKKIIRIQRSVLLINEGFLKESTFDSLATEIGFSSYSAFFKSFKNIIGKSPQEYCNQLHIKQ
jgi:AraC-like DNA-binding protein